MMNDFASVNTPVYASFGDKEGVSSGTVFATGGLFVVIVDELDETIVAEDVELPAP